VQPARAGLAGGPREAVPVLILAIWADAVVALDEHLAPARARRAARQAARTERRRQGRLVALGVRRAF
jgi:ABC-type uncharacterized transport system ATPase component